MGIIIDMRTRERWRGNKRGGPKAVRQPHMMGCPPEFAMPGRRGGEVGKAAYVGTGFEKVGFEAARIVERLARK